VSPSTFIAISLAGVSLCFVAWKAIKLRIRVRVAFNMAESLHNIASSERVWEFTERTQKGDQVRRLDRVSESLALLSMIDLEGYLVDKRTQKLIDSSLFIFRSEFPEQPFPKNL